MSNDKNHFFTVSPWTRGISLFLLAFCFSGCASSIAIHHQDPTYKRVSVKIDNRQRGELNYGGTKTVGVSRGAHQVEVVPVGSTASPWTQDGKGWIVWVDKDAILTLLPPAPTNRKAAYAEMPINQSPPVVPPAPSRPDPSSSNNATSSVEGNPYSKNAPVRN